MFEGYLALIELMKSCNKDAFPCIEQVSELNIKLSWKKSGREVYSITVDNGHLTSFRLAQKALHKAKRDMNKMKRKIANAK